MSSLSEIYDLVNTAIDAAFIKEKYQLNFYDYLESEKIKKEQIQSFISSSLGIAIVHQIEELDLYLDGGSQAAFVRESYGWMGKPRARKMKEYLEKIMNDAKKYEQSKRSGRKRKTTNK